MALCAEAAFVAELPELQFEPKSPEAEPAGSAGLQIEPNGPVVVLCPGAAVEWESALQFEPKWQGSGLVGSATGSAALQFEPK
jgi:hypothetical protein